MPKHTPNSRGKIHSMRSSNKRQQTAVAALLGAETDPGRRFQLAHARSAILDQAIEINRLAADYAKSNLAPSPAEQRLAAGAEGIKSHTQNLTNLTQLLNSIAGVASILANLFSIFG